MPIPAPYARGYNYVAWQAGNPNAPLPAASVTADYDAIAAFSLGAVSALNEQLALIQALQVALPPEGSSAVAAAASAAAALASQNAAAASAATATTQAGIATTQANLADADRIACAAALAAATVAGTASNTAPLANGTAAPGVSLQFSRADHVHPATNSVSNGVRFINATFLVDQLGNAAGLAVASGAGRVNVVDQWSGSRVGAAAFTLSRAFDPDFAQGSYLNAAVTTGAGLGVSSDFAVPFTYRFEGLEVADLGWGTAQAKQVTISFEFQSNVTGVYAVAFRNSALNRCRVETFNYTVAAAKQRVTITVPGDTTGAWLTGEGQIGLEVFIAAVSGTSGHVAAAGAWGASGFSAAACVNWGASAANYVRISGPQLSKGAVAPPFDRQSIAQEAIACRRYYLRVRLLHQAPTTGFSAVPVQYPVPMASAGALSFTDVGSTSATSITAAPLNNTGGYLQFQATAASGAVHGDVFVDARI